MIHYSVSDDTVEVRIDQPPVKRPRRRHDRRSDRRARACRRRRRCARGADRERGAAPCSTTGVTPPYAGARFRQTAPSSLLSFTLYLGTLKAAQRASDSTTREWDGIVSMVGAWSHWRMPVTHLLN